ncbi:MAG: DUF6531 domain-containing protein, partial [Polynucleobacter sp.]|nr:DUF6531 domain-containing protein [Polynucleobacter sp.]
MNEHQLNGRYMKKSIIGLLLLPILLLCSVGVRAGTIYYDATPSYRYYTGPAYATPSACDPMYFPARPEACVRWAECQNFSNKSYPYWQSQMVSDTVCKVWTPLPYYMESYKSANIKYTCHPGDWLFDGNKCYGACPVGDAGATSCAPVKVQAPSSAQAQSCSDQKFKDLFTTHPIHISTGNKHLTERDYAASGIGNLNLVRFYNSQNNAARSTFGTAWRHDYDSYITPSFYSSSKFVAGDAQTVLAVRPNGNAYAFTVNGTTYTSQDPDVTDTLTAIIGSNGVVTGWTYRVTANNSVETYNATGKLVSIQDRAGQVLTLTYNAGLLTQVADAFGRQLNFTYDAANRIATMTDPANGQYVYAYDANNNLASVTYPDLKTKTYLYNEAAYT